MNRHHDTVGKSRKVDNRDEQQRNKQAAGAQLLAQGRVDQENRHPQHAPTSHHSDGRIIASTEIRSMLPFATLTLTIQV